MRFLPLARSTPLKVRRAACLLLSAAIVATPALADEPAPGDACAVAGAYTHAGGPEVEDDRGFMLVCSGANNVWESVLEYSTESGRAKINVDYDGDACTAAKTGRLRYNPSTDLWEYCDGSDPWRPFEQAGSAGLSGPADCSDIGDACNDGTVFAGFHPVLHEHLFIPPTDQGTGAWKTSTGANDIATDSTWDGRANANQVANSTTFPAFKLCKDLATGGHSDWYLPSRVELYYLWAVHESIEAGGNVTNFLNGLAWSSSESDANSAVVQNFGGGAQTGSAKTNASWVRCVRR